MGESNIPMTKVKEKHTQFHKLEDIKVFRDQLTNKREDLVRIFFGCIQSHRLKSHWSINVLRPACIHIIKKRVLIVKRHVGWVLESSSSVCRWHAEEEIPAGSEY